MVVSERGADCISIFSSELEQIMSVRSEGAGAYQFHRPRGIAITNDSRVLVVDKKNYRIL